MDKRIDYMMWAGSSSSAKQAIEHYTRKYGRPPEILIVSPDSKPLEGMNVVVKTEKYVPVNLIYVGNVAENLDEN